MVKAQKPLLGFAAYSGTGKTTLLRRLLPLLKQRGLRLGVVKHAHHAFEVDQPGKDSYELRKAGASQMLVASARRWALMVEESSFPGDPRLQDVLEHLDQKVLDLILVEGFKHEALPKIELFRPSLGHGVMYPNDPHVVAIATDGEIPETTGLPVLDLNDLAGIADFVVRWMEPEASGSGRRS